jgi:hypothetical protein
MTSSCLAGQPLGGRCRRALMMTGTWRFLRAVSNQGTIVLVRRSAYVSVRRYASRSSSRQQTCCSRHETHDTRRRAGSKVCSQLLPPAHHRSTHRQRCPWSADSISRVNTKLHVLGRYTRSNNRFKSAIKHAYGTGLHTLQQSGPGPPVHPVAAADCCDQECNCRQIYTGH